MTRLKDHQVIDREYRRLLELVVGGMAELTSSRLSGDDSPYVNPWLEYAAQVQGQHSFAFSTYEDLLRQFCNGQATSLPDESVLILWNGTGGCADWSEADLPHLDLMREHISQELFCRVETKAANEELPR
jgi:hypothetical protein